MAHIEKLAFKNLGPSDARLVFRPHRILMAIMIPAWVEGNCSRLKARLHIQRGLKDKRSPSLVLRWEPNILIQATRHLAIPTRRGLGNTLLHPSEWEEDAAICAPRPSGRRAVASLRLSLEQSRSGRNYRADVAMVCRALRWLKLLWATAPVDMPLACEPMRMATRGCRITIWLTDRGRDRHRFTPWLRIYRRHMPR